MILEECGAKVFIEFKYEREFNGGSGMKRARGHGLILSVILNMLFRAYWLVLVCILLVLHFAAGWPLWLIAIPLVCWFLHSLLITLVLGWANESASAPKPVQENKNPYSVRKTQENKNPYSVSKVQEKPSETGREGSSDFPDTK